MAFPWAPLTKFEEVREEGAKGGGAKGKGVREETVRDAGSGARGGGDEGWAQARQWIAGMSSSASSRSESVVRQAQAQTQAQTQTPGGGTSGAPEQAVGVLLSGFFDGMTPVAEAPQKNSSEASEAALVAGSGANLGTFEVRRPAPAAGAAAAVAGLPVMTDSAASKNEVSSSFALASSSTGSLADTVIRVLNSLGLDAGKYEGRLQEARSALLVSIGVGGTEPLDGYSPDWTFEGKPFDAGMAALLAHAAFESYNDPAGGKWEVHQDGTRSAYLSPDFIREMYAGILMVKLRNLSLATRADSESSSPSTPASATVSRRSSSPGANSVSSKTGGDIASRQNDNASGWSQAAKSAFGVGEGPDSYLRWMGLGGGEEKRQGREAEAPMGTKTLQLQQRTARVRLELPNCVHAADSEARVIVPGAGGAGSKFSKVHYIVTYRVIILGY
jgi:hypothetical protein